MNQQKRAVFPCMCHAMSHKTSVASWLIVHLRGEHKPQVRITPSLLCFFFFYINQVSTLAFLQMVNVQLYPSVYDVQDGYKKLQREGLEPSPKENPKQNLPISPQRNGGCIRGKAQRLRSILTACAAGIDSNKTSIPPRRVSHAREKGEGREKVGYRRKTSCPTPFVSKRTQTLAHRAVCECVTVLYVALCLHVLFEQEAVQKKR